MMRPTINLSDKMIESLRNACKVTLNDLHSRQPLALDSCNSARDQVAQRRNKATAQARLAKAERNLAIFNERIVDTQLALDMLNEMLERGRS